MLKIDGEMFLEAQAILWKTDSFILNYCGFSHCIIANITNTVFNTIFLQIESIQSR